LFWLRWAWQPERTRIRPHSNAIAKMASRSDARPTPLAPSPSVCVSPTAQTSARNPTVVIMDAADRIGSSVEEANQNEWKVMHDKFDELAKGLAQSVTRRGALKKFGVGLVGIVMVAHVVWAAPPDDLYVDANAGAGGDGSPVHPYSRITDAVQRARSDRQN